MHNTQNRGNTLDFMSSMDRITAPNTFNNSERQDEPLVVISNVVLNMVKQGDKLQWSHRWFCSPSGKVAPIALEAYIARLFKYGQFNKDCFVRALVYMDRLIEGGFIFNSNNIHRAFLVAVMCSAKFFEDEPCDNRFYALLGGIGKAELNTLEVQFLFMIDWNINISALVYDNYFTAFRYKMSKIEYSLYPTCDSTKVASWCEVVCRAWHGLVLYLCIIDSIFRKEYQMLLFREERIKGGSHPLIVNTSTS